MNLKHQKEEGKGPSGARARVGRRTEGKIGDLTEYNSRGALSFQPSAPHCSRLAQSPPGSKDDVPATRTAVPPDAKKVFSPFIPTPCPRQHPSPGCREEPEQARSPGTWCRCLPLSHLLFVHRHTWGPDIKAFKTEEKRRNRRALLAGKWLGFGTLPPD